jgi:hypothetical protein
MRQPRHLNSYFLAFASPLFIENDTMRWDADRLSSKDVTLGENGCSASNAKGSWHLVLGDEYLSSGIVEVEIATENVDNLSLFIGVASPAYWDEWKAALKEGEEELAPRDSKNCICMHGDGRCFIRGMEKDWGLMRLATGSTLSLILDFERGVVTFRNSRVVRGKAKETEAEIAGLFPSATLVACFGGRDQVLTIASCAPRKGGTAEGDEAGGASGRRRVKDVFADALSGDRIAPIAFTAPSVVGTYEEQIRDVAATMESSM